jgi:hypothetical protein
MDKSGPFGYAKVRNLISIEGQEYASWSRKGSIGVNVSQCRVQHRLASNVVVGQPCQRAIVFDSDQQFATIGVGKCDQSLCHILEDFF